MLSAAVVIGALRVKEDSLKYRIHKIKKLLVVNTIRKIKYCVSLVPRVVIVIYQLYQFL